MSFFDIFMPILVALVAVSLFVGLAIVKYKNADKSYSEENLDNQMADKKLTSIKKTRYCKYCGSELKDNKSKCKSCGATSKKNNKE